MIAMVGAVALVASSHKGFGPSELVGGEFTWRHFAKILFAFVFLHLLGPETGLPRRGSYPRPGLAQPPSGGRRLPLFPHARSLTLLVGGLAVARSESQLAINLLKADESTSLAQIHAHIKSFSKVSLRPLPACYFLPGGCPSAYLPYARPWPVLFPGRQTPLAARDECLLGMAPSCLAMDFPASLPSRLARRPGGPAHATTSSPGPFISLYVPCLIISRGEKSSSPKAPRRATTHQAQAPA
jgi:hypothetical protein